MTRNEVINTILEMMKNCKVKTEHKHLGNSGVPTIYEHGNTKLWTSDDNLWWSDDNEGSAACIAYDDINDLSRGTKDNELFISAGSHGCIKLTFKSRAKYTLNLDLFENN